MATGTDFALLSGRSLVRSGLQGGVPMLRNVCFGILDYLVQPLLMLATARYFVHHLGISQFGIWMLVLAIIGSTGTLCTGFGDAALKYVSMMRGRSDSQSTAEVIQSSLALNLGFGITMAVVLFALSPWASMHIFRLGHDLAPMFTTALRIGGAVLVLRSLSFVFISTLRAFERYKTSTQIASLGRLAIVVVALSLTMYGHGVVAIMLATLLCDFAAFGAFTLAVRRVVGPIRFKPGFQFRSSRSLAAFGAFSWLQALSGTLFSQADRMLVASLLGPAALGYYGVCLQAAQPIHGLMASGSNVLFPHLSVRVEREGPGQLSSFLSKVFRLNLIGVTVLTLPLALLSRPILNRWMGPEFSQHAATSLSLVSLSFALLALNIPGHYALMALGRVRFLAALNIFGGAFSLLVALALIPHFGIAGAAVGRLCYGPITWLLYPRLRKVLAESNATAPVPA